LSIGDVIRHDHFEKVAEQGALFHGSSKDRMRRNRTLSVAD
jgi:hypothetical protein